jgi:peptidoglycan LD-endopeptidase LytH
MANSARLRFLFIFLLLVAVVAGLVWLLQRKQRSTVAVEQVKAASPAVTPQLSPVATPTPTPTESPSPTESIELPTPFEHEESSTPQSPAIGDAGEINVVVPVLGVPPSQLHDTFDDARSEGRVHDAIDIPAPQGTPVIAAAEGVIIKLFESERGGTTIYQLSKDRKLVYYYAHLQRYADGLVAGKVVQQGEVIAYVGDTGNAGTGNYHLHFSIAAISDPKRYWEGTNINPYPLLHK